MTLERLRFWRTDGDLVGLRDPDAVGRLPADEQEACRQLWAEVLALIARASVASSATRLPYGFSNTAT
jgi:hypothetical protein